MGVESFEPELRRGLLCEVSVDVVVREGPMHETRTVKVLLSQAAHS